MADTARGGLKGWRKGSGPPRHGIGPRHRIQRTWRWMGGNNGSFQDATDRSMHLRLPGLGTLGAHSIKTKKWPYLGLDGRKRDFEGTSPLVETPLLVVSTLDNAPNACLGPRFQHTQEGTTIACGCDFASSVYPSLVTFPSYQHEPHRWVACIQGGIDNKNGDFGTYLRNSTTHIISCTSSFNPPPPPPTLMAR